MSPPGHSWVYSLTRRNSNQSDLVNVQLSVTTPPVNSRLAPPPAPRARLWARTGISFPVQTREAIAAVEAPPATCSGIRDWGAVCEKQRAPQ